MITGALVCVTCLRALSPFQAQPVNGQAVALPETQALQLFQEFEQELVYPEIASYRDRLKTHAPDAYRKLYELLEGDSYQARKYRLFLGQIHDLALQRYPNGKFALDYTHETESQHKTMIIRLLDRRNPNNQVEYFCKSMSMVESRHEELTHQVLDLLAFPRVEMIHGPSPWSGEVLYYSPRKRGVELKELEKTYQPWFNSKDRQQLRKDYGKIMALWFFWGKGDPTHNQIYDPEAGQLIFLDHENLAPPFQWINHPAFQTKEHIQQVPRVPATRRKQLTTDLRRLLVLHKGKAFRTTIKGFDEGLEFICGKLDEDPSPLREFVFRKLEIAQAVQYHEILVGLTRQLPALATLGPKISGNLSLQHSIVKGWYAKTKERVPGTTWGFPWDFAYGEIDQAFEEIRARHPRWSSKLTRQAREVKQQLTTSYQRWKALMIDSQLIKQLAKERIVWMKRPR